MLKIQNCENSYIYVDSCVDFLSIDNCSKCTIFVAAVKFITHVNKCEKISMTNSANIIQIGNTIDSKFYTFSTYEPIFFGDNKSIFMGPNNSNYVEMIQRIKKANIAFNTKSLINFAYPFVFHEFWNTSSGTFSIEAPKDFFPLILPDQFIQISYPLSLDLHTILNMDYENLMKKSIQGKQPEDVYIPILAPQNYKDKILERIKMVSKLKEKIKGSGLAEEETRLLMDSVQGLFREWMSGNSESKMIMEIVKWIDND